MIWRTPASPDSLISVGWSDESWPIHSGHLSGAILSRPPRPATASSGEPTSRRTQLVAMTAATGSITSVTRASRATRENSIGSRGPSDWKLPDVGSVRGSQSSEPQARQPIAMPDDRRRTVCRNDCPKFGSALTGRSAITPNGNTLDGVGWGRPHLREGAKPFPLAA